MTARLPEPEDRVRLKPLTGVVVDTADRPGPWVDVMLPGGDKPVTVRAEHVTLVDAEPLPELRAGVYRHWKGHHYLVFGYGHDANAEGRAVVVYVGLELDDAHTGPRLAVRDVDDFFAYVDPSTGERAALGNEWGLPRRFTYMGPTWEGAR